jgi:hypothetical protein
MALTWKFDGEIIGLTALVMADAAAFQSGMNPSFFTMRAFTSSGGEKAENTKTDIHIGETIGTVLALTAGIGASLVSSSWWPFAGTILTLVVIIAAYEYALSHPHDYASIEAQ